MEAFAMTVYRAGAGQRSFSLPLTFCVLAGTVLLATGCATQPVRPVPYEQANTASWFSQSGSSDLSESYKADYEEGRAAYAAEDYADAVNRYGALAEQGVPEAAYELGKAYRYGNGVPADSEDEAQWMIAEVSQAERTRSQASHTRK